MLKNIKYWFDYKLAIKSGSPSQAYGALVKCYRKKCSYTKSQRFELLQIICGDSDEAYDTLISNYYIQLDGDERLLIFSTLLRSTKRKKYISDLIDRQFIFDAIEMNLIVCYLLKFNLQEEMEYLLKRYSLPNYCADILSSNLVMSKLTGG